MHELRSPADTPGVSADRIASVCARDEGSATDRA
jgi:hypothetical protein